MRRRLADAAVEKRTRACVLMQIDFFDSLTAERHLVRARSETIDGRARRSGVRAKRHG
jgi:hypothetical protein